MRRRWIHRRGAIFEATLQPPDEATDQSGTGEARRALVRYSNTFGWPSPLPDWAGLAVRMFDGNGGHVDVLLVSSAPEPELWRQMRPSRDLLGCTFSSVARYRLDGTGDGRVVSAVPLEARSADLDDLVAGEMSCPIRYRLDAAVSPGGWQTLGELTLTRRLTDDGGVRFAPPPDGRSRIDALRRRLYRWAQGSFPRSRR